MPRILRADAHTTDDLLPGRTRAIEAGEFRARVESLLRALERSDVVEVVRAVVDYGRRNVEQQRARP